MIQPLTTRAILSSLSDPLHLQRFGSITARRYEHLTTQYSGHRQQDITFSVTGDCRTPRRPWTTHTTYEKDYIWFPPQHSSVKSCFMFTQCLRKPDDPDVTHQKRVLVTLPTFDRIKVWNLPLLTEDASHLSEMSPFRNQLFAYSIYVPQAITMCTHAAWHAVLCMAKKMSPRAAHTGQRSDQLRTMLSLWLQGENTQHVSVRITPPVGLFSDDLNRKLFYHTDILFTHF